MSVVKSYPLQWVVSVLSGEFCLFRHFNSLIDVEVLIHVFLHAETFVVPHSANRTLEFNVLVQWGQDLLLCDACVLHQLCKAGRASIFWSLDRE